MTDPIPLLWTLAEAGRAMGGISARSLNSTASVNRTLRASGRAIKNFPEPFPEGLTTQGNAMAADETIGKATEQSFEWVGRSELGYD